MAKHILTNDHQLKYLADCVRFAQTTEGFSSANGLDEFGDEIDDYLLDILVDTIDYPDDNTLHGWVL